MQKPKSIKQLYLARASAKLLPTPPKQVRIFALTVDAFGSNPASLTRQMTSKLLPPITTGRCASLLLSSITRGRCVSLILEAMWCCLFSFCLFKFALGVLWSLRLHEKFTSKDCLPSKNKVVDEKHLGN